MCSVDFSIVFLKGTPYQIVLKNANFPGKKVANTVVFCWFLHCLARVPPYKQLLKKQRFLMGYLGVIFGGSWGDPGGILGHFGGILGAS